MSRFTREELLARFHAMIRNGEPIIGGGAGTGLSAKCEEAGGIDLIIIYNSGRYRMAGRGSLAGMLAYGNANDIVLDMAREVLPVVKKTPVLAGVNGTDPFCLFDDFLDRLAALGFAGIQNFPTVGLFDGKMRANLEETGMGYGLEVDLVRLAHRKNMLTTPYAFTADEAVEMTKAGADLLVCHMGLTTGGAIGAATALTLADSARLITADDRRGAAGPRRHHRAVPWRTDLRAGGRRIHPQIMPRLPRVLRRLLDGASAGGTRPHRADTEVQGDRKVSGGLRATPVIETSPF